MNMYPIGHYSGRCGAPHRRCLMADGKFGEQLDDQLQQLREKIDATKAKAEAKGREFMGKYESDLEKLESLYELARYKLTLLRKGGKSALQELREGAEKAYQELKEAVGKAKEKL